MDIVNKLRMLRVGVDQHVDLELVFAKKAVYDRIAALFPTHKGKQLSFEEREAADNQSTTLVYGEIKFEPFAIAVEKIRRRYGGLSEPGKGVYYDIGSGTGKPVFAAALMHPFARAVGVEILESLHNAALETLGLWKKLIAVGRRGAEEGREEAGGAGGGALAVGEAEAQDQGKRGMEGSGAAAPAPATAAPAAATAAGVPLIDAQTAATKIEFVHGDITRPGDIDISDATLLFANSTHVRRRAARLSLWHFKCFDDALLLAVADAADRCAIGTFFITFTKEVPSRKWMVLESERYSMSWGVATVFIHIKIMP